MREPMDVQFRWGWERFRGDSWLRNHQKSTTKTKKWEEATPSIYLVNLESTYIQLATNGWLYS